MSTAPSTPRRQSSSRFREHPSIGEVREQQVEVNEAREGLPRLRRQLDGGVVERTVSREPVRAVVSGADVVAGKDVNSAEAAETRERDDAQRLGTAEAERSPVGLVPRMKE